MPYVKIEVTREGVTRQQKQQLIAGVTELITEVLESMRCQKQEEPIRTGPAI